MKSLHPSQTVWKTCSKYGNSYPFGSVNELIFQRMKKNQIGRNQISYFKSSMSKYNKLQNYEEISLNPATDIFRCACCDCALVHDMRIVIECKDKVTIIFRDNKRATAQLRRHRWGNLQKDSKRRYRLVRQQ